MTPPGFGASPVIISIMLSSHPPTPPLRLPPLGQPVTGGRSYTQAPPKRKAHPRPARPSHVLGGRWATSCAHRFSRREPPTPPTPFGPRSSVAYVLGLRPRHVITHESPRTLAPLALGVYGYGWRGFVALWRLCSCIFDNYYLY